MSSTVGLDTPLPFGGPFKLNKKEQESNENYTWNAA